MTKIFVKPNHLNRDEFLTPFDKVFDHLMEQTFPTFKEDVLIISGDKHGFDDSGGKCITRELKQSAFTRSFNLGEYLDGKNVSASFKDGMLSISVPKIEPEKPKKTFVKIS